MLLAMLPALICARIPKMKNKELENNEVYWNLKSFCKFELICTSVVKLLHLLAI